MTTNDNKSIVKQFLNEVRIVDEAGTHYSICNAEESIDNMTGRQLETFCKELELLLEMRECMYNTMDKWKKEDGERNSK